jgi:hypothetical protein
VIDVNVLKQLPTEFARVSPVISRHVALCTDEADWAEACSAEWTERGEPSVALLMGQLHRVSLQPRGLDAIKADE